jgi:LysR family transcriptional regulator, transcriptional activator of the cysJI operon
MHIELEARLRAFAAFARQGSITAAADELVISQPAVSKHIAELEKKLGVDLIRRQGRRVMLTPAGEFLAGYVLRAEALLAQAAHGLRSFADPMSGRLAIAASGTPGNYLLPSPLAAFHEQFPGVEVVLEMGTSAEVIDAVRAHRFEIGVVGGFGAAPEMDVESLLEDEVVIVASAGKASSIESAKDLEEVTWITREEGSATRATVEAALKDHGLSPRRWLYLPSWEAVKLAVAAGAGVTACSGLVVEAEVHLGLLAIISLPGWGVRRGISLVTVRDAPMTEPARRFVEMLKEEIGRKSARAVGAER